MAHRSIDAPFRVLRQTGNVTRLLRPGGRRDRSSRMGRMLPHRFKLQRHLASGLFGSLIVAAAWWGGSVVGTAQTTDVPAPTPGRVEGASDILSLGTAATGTVAELLVRPGARVQAGQHLLRIECSNIER